MSVFTQHVCQIIARIPRGNVATYGQVAALAGRPRAARGVGFILRSGAADGLPCHRVLFADGALCQGDVFGSPAIQRDLLEQEGVLFLPDGRVDLARCRWQPEKSG